MQPLGHEPVLRQDHVVVPVAWKPGAQSVARFGGATVSDVVREDEVMARGIERLPRAVQLAGEEGRQKLAARAARSVEDEHRVPHHAGRIAAGTAQRQVMQSQLRQRLAAREAEVAEHEGGGVSGRRHGDEQAQQGSHAR